jgi:D-serine deaminase-like pyridoxal phosphate-dependent protein
VVSRPTPTRIVLDCGSKSLSSDIGNLTGYGQLMGTDITIKFVNEEHGVIELDAPADSPRIGDRVRVVPNHVCVVSNLFDVVNLIEGDTVVETLPVAARGRVD